MRNNTGYLAVGQSLCLALALAATAGSLEAELIAYFPFDGDFNDASGNGNHLSVAEGSPTIIRTPGDFMFGGGALDMTSSVGDRSFLELANPFTFGNDDSWSIAFWARRRAGSDDRQGMIIGDTANSRDFVWLSNNPTQVQGMRFRSTDNSNFNHDVGPDDGGWHHWALAADGAGNLTVYRDNLLLGTSAGATSFSVKNVAHGYNTNVYSMNGQIDELYVYDDWIGAAEVEALFLGPGSPAFEITDLSYDPGENTVTLTWTSREGAIYAVRASSDLRDFDFEFDGAVMADGGEQTARTFDLSDFGLEGSETLYFQVRTL